MVGLQMMLDHLHAILFVTEKMKRPLGKVPLGVKQACNQAFRDVIVFLICYFFPFKTSVNRKPTRNIMVVPKTMAR